MGVGVLSEPMDWAQAGLTLGAVVVGASASTAGSIWARRLDIRHERRAELRRLLGLARRALGSKYPPRDQELRLPQSQLDAVGEVTRLGVIIGPKEYELTMEVAQVLIEIELFQRFAPSAGVDAEVHQKLAKSLDNLTHHLTMALGPRPARRRAKG